MIVLIDNGHGINTYGKCSPDKRLMEWAWTREIAVRLAKAMMDNEIFAQRIVTENYDIPLYERCRRVNDICIKNGSDNVVLVSVHVNAAASDGQWHEARGFMVWVSKKGSANSKRLAQLMYAEAEKRNLKGDRWVPKERYWKKNFTIITETACPAVLTENLFQDNREDVDYLLSEEGKQAIVDLHVEALKQYIGK